MACKSLHLLPPEMRGVLLSKATVTNYKTCIYYLTDSIAGFFAQSGYHQAELRVSFRLNSLLEALGENLLSGSFLLLAGSNFCGCRTMVPIFLLAVSQRWLSTRSHS